MNINLTGKTAIVTGSTDGIGLAIATGLAQAGASVVITGRTQDRIDAALEKIQAAATNAPKVLGVLADIGTAEGCQTLIATQPGADILVNALGIYGGKEFFDISDADWDEIYQVNVLSGIRLSRHYGKGMKEKAGAGFNLFPVNRPLIYLPKWFTMV